MAKPVQATKSKSQAKSSAKHAMLQQALQLAMHLHQSGKVAEAAQRYRAILAMAPQQIDALHYLGVAQHQLGQSHAAADLIRQVLVLQPDYIDAHNNLGNILQEMGEAVEAEAAYRKVLAARPQFAQAQNNLGVVLVAQGRFAEAIQAYRQCLSMQAEFAEGWHNLGNALKKNGEIDECLTAYRQAILFAPYTPNAYLELAGALKVQRRYAEALDVYRQWQKLEPDNPVIEHMIAALHGSDIPVRASDAYLQKTFDSFAASFDEVLRGLEYRSPALAGQLVAQLLPPPAANLAVLDVGCGTGLCAEYVKPYAKHLLGVDLSGGMLAQAAQRGLYDQLIEAELTSFLQAQHAAFDVMICCDTLNYFGVLDEVMQAAAQALRGGGYFVVSLEKTPELMTDAAYTLHQHGRYSHTEAYLRQVTQAAGLHLCQLQDVVIRKESEQDVVGWLLAMQKV